MRRGDVSTYDSSVNIEIKEYRKIRRKVLSSDSLIIAMSLHVAYTDTLIKRFEDKISTLAATAVRHEATIADKNQTIKKLSADFDNLATLSKKLRIFKNPISDGAVKFVGGVLVGLLISKL
jgi:hypothetical protein